MYKCQYFTIQELVHPQILNAIGETNSWMRLDKDCLIDLDIIRKTWGREIYINVGAADSRGLRPPNDSDGAFYSVHKQGKAFDLVDSEGDNIGLYNHISILIHTNKIKAFNTLENIKFTKTWVHAAKMNHADKLKIIDP